MHSTDWFNRRYYEDCIPYATELTQNAELNIINADQKKKTNNNTSDRNQKHSERKHVYFQRKTNEGRYLSAFQQLSRHIGVGHNAIIGGARIFAAGRLALFQGDRHEITSERINRNGWP